MRNRHVWKSSCVILIRALWVTTRSCSARTVWSEARSHPTYIWEKEMYKWKPFQCEVFCNIFNIFRCPQRYASTIFITILIYEMGKAIMQISTNDGIKFHQLITLLVNVPLYNDRTDQKYRMFKERSALGNCAICFHCFP